MRGGVRPEMGLSNRSELGCDPRAEIIELQLICIKISTMKEVFSEKCSSYIFYLAVDDAFSSISVT